MEAWIEQPWNLRWWRMPGETLLSQSIDGTQATIVFTWCNPGEWGLEFVLDGGRPQDAIFFVDSGDIIDIDAVPRAVVVALMDQFKIRERQIQDAPKLAVTRNGRWSRWPGTADQRHERGVGCRDGTGQR